MRGKWNHLEPRDTQPIPADNTSEYVRKQVALHRQTGKLIHPEVAMEIAAWHHSPQSPGITAFASSGTILVSLVPEIERERAANPDTSYAVEALIAYVKASPGPVAFETFDSYAAEALAQKILKRGTDYVHTFTPHVLVGVVHALQDVVDGQELDDATLDTAEEFLLYVGEQYGIKIEGK
ncbi:hypothetical protein ACFP2T_43335 [Plantactinospora solaniradicis]|uniref:Uncharacterized protein n=1 Tax=Plantactinospora solaniradicis TaxID=1723736 RepID=A0ABW1KPW9_9ACTN